MSTVHRTSPHVHSRPTIALVGLPETSRDENEPFNPSPEDEAYDLGYRLARDGESPLCPYRTTGLNMRFVVGRIDGTRVREVAEAFRLGEDLGYRTGISEPPAGFSADEKAAYRRGFAVGYARFEEEREFEAWVASEEEWRTEEIHHAELTDADQCVSPGYYT